MDIQFDEKKSVDFLKNVLSKSGLKFRIKSSNEEGGFFYNENGERKKFSENIFVKRSMKYELPKLIFTNDIFADGNEYEVDIPEMTYNLSVISSESTFEEKSYETVKYFDLKDNRTSLSVFKFLSSSYDAA